MEYQTKFAITVTIVLIVVTVTFGVLSCEQFSKTEQVKTLQQIELKHAMLKPELY